MANIRVALLLGICALYAVSAWGNVEQIRALLEESVRMNQEGRQTEAEPLARQAISLAESFPGQPSAKARLLASAQQQFGVSLRLQGRQAEAEAVLREALRLAERAHGHSSRLAVKARIQLGLAILGQGRYGEADKVLREAMARIPEPGDAGTLDLWLEARCHLGRLQVLTGNQGEAENLLKIVLDKTANTHDEPSRRWRQNAATSMATLRQRQQRHEDAEPLAREAAEVAATVWGPGHWVTAEAYGNLGHILFALGRSDEAETWLRKAVALVEAREGGYGGSAKPYAQLGQLLAGKGTVVEAGAMLSKALALAERTASPEVLAHVLRAYARFLLDQDQPERALPLFERAVSQADRLFALSRGMDATARENKAAALRPIYAEAVKNRITLDRKQPGQGHDQAALADVSRTQSRLFTEMLRTADVSRLMGDARFAQARARRDDALARLSELRRRLALTASLERDGEEIHPVRPIADPFILERWRKEVSDLRRSIAQAESDRDEAEATLWREFPRFMELEEPRPVTVTELRERWLRPGETLLAYFRLKNQLLIFLVSREEFRLVRVPVGMEELDGLVAKARQPMEGGGRVDLLASLDPGVLSRLYDLLLKPVEDRLPAGRRLIIVGDGPLYTLPMEMLVRRWGDAERARFLAARKGDLSEYGLLDYAGARWPFSYMPSLAALAIQRAGKRVAVAARHEFIAFADPVFEREDAMPPTATRALLADLGAARGGRISIPRLPETADEVEAVARLLEGAHKIFLRDQAQEAQIKHLDLSRTRYLHFATHGLLGGQFAMVKGYEAGGDGPKDGQARGRSLEVMGDDEATASLVAPVRGQPALVLTLVGNLEGEDGLLTMSEVMDLKMDADLVVLSACNTAGELVSTRNGEGFAGLTRAFMHAGSRGLLVSHWSVESLATRDLITDTFRRLKAGAMASIALAEAKADMRGSGSALSRPSRAHPFFWAPFVHVGD